MLKKIAALLALLALLSCSDAVKKDFDLTESGVKSLDKGIVEVELTPQVDGTAKLVEIRVHADPGSGGAGEWNSVAQDSHRLFSVLLTKPEVGRVRIFYVSPANKGIDWAQVYIARNSLPSNWRELTYLQFFAETKPLAGTLQSVNWLCDFYQKYRSALPVSGLPVNCK